MSKMDYFKPNEVLSPRKYVEFIEEIHDGGEDSFSLAKIKWEGEECIGIRWNVSQGEWEDNDKIKNIKKCVGMPISRGYPAWFILPDDFLNELLNPTPKILTEVKNHLLKK